MRPGTSRIAIFAVLQAGVVGTFDAIAQHAGIPEHHARTTLKNLRREGQVAVHCTSASRAARAGRPRVVYGLASATPDAPAFDSLAFACQVWRQAPQTHL